MATVLLTDRYREQISGVLDCYDRMIFTGTLPQLYYAEGMTAFLHAKKIRIFDYPTMFAEPLRDQLRGNAEKLAKEHGVDIEFIRRIDAFRKEDRIKKILQQRGDSPGLVHIFSAMEACTAYRPWHDKKTGKTMVKPTDGKCLHYYFYFRLLKRLRVHGLLKKASSTYKYYLTLLGQRLVAAALKLREQFFIPQLAWGRLA